MTIVYLVRHGQASFGAKDYDKLSEAGWQQARWLGEDFAHRGLEFDRAYTGSLRRHKETFQGIVEGFGAGAESWANAKELAGLNEYESRPVLEAKLGKKLGHEEEQALSKDKRAYFRLLREALMDWANARVLPEGPGSFAHFRDGLFDALDQACAQASEKPVLIVSSGGPISNIVGSLLRVPLEITIDLNLQTRNASFSEFAFGAGGVASRRLMSFNNIPHLDTKERAGWITYA